MKAFIFSYGEITQLADQVAEIIINDGVELTHTNIIEVEQWLQDNITKPYLLLINKRQSYTYSFEAQQQIAQTKHVKKTAVVCYSNISLTSSRFVLSNNPPIDPAVKTTQVRFFTQREAALAWLLQDLAPSSDADQ